MTLVKRLNINEYNRQEWLARVLTKLPDGHRILDAGAGELKNRVYCNHLNYVSQDFCEFEGGGKCNEGLQFNYWDTSRIDIVSDISDIPEPDASFDAILCSEVLEHIPEPTDALNEFARLLKPGGVLILTAPFSSNVHMAPYYFCTGFSKYWYEYHLVQRGFEITELVPNGDWYTLLRQEIMRLGRIDRQGGIWVWPIGYAYALLGLLYFGLRGKYSREDIACFGWQVLAVKRAV